MGIKFWLSQGYINTSPKVHRWEKTISHRKTRRQFRLAQ